MGFIRNVGGKASPNVAPTCPEGLLISHRTVVVRLVGVVARSVSSRACACGEGHWLVYTHTDNISAYCVVILINLEQSTEVYTVNINVTLTLQVNIIWFVCFSDIK